MSCQRADGVGKTLTFAVNATNTFILNVANGQEYNVTVHGMNRNVQGATAFTAVTPTGLVQDWQASSTPAGEKRA